MGSRAGNFLGNYGELTGQSWAIVGICGQLWATLGNCGQLSGHLWATFGQPLAIGANSLGNSGQLWATLGDSWNMMGNCVVLRRVCGPAGQTAGRECNSRMQLPDAAKISPYQLLHGVSVPVLPPDCCAC